MAEANVVDSVRNGDDDSARRVDVVVIGSGVGGLCAAARLAHRGLSVLVVERDPRVGGRASTVEQDGFLLPTGGIALELGGAMESLFREVGARYDVRAPAPGVLVRLGRRSVNTTSAMSRLLVDKLLLRLAGIAVARWRRPAPERARSLSAGIARWTRGRVARRLARNFAAGSFGLNSDEVSAHAMLTFLTQKGAFRRYGFGPRGTIGVMEELADVVRRRDGDVWLSTSAERILTADGRARGVVVCREDGERVEVACDAVVSNAGPAATVQLVGPENLPASYVARVEELDVPTPMIVVDIASQHPLMEEAGIVFFGTTDRLAAIGHLTSTCPEVAPSGWHLYVAYAVPVPALGDFDEAAEVEATMAELRDQLQDLDRAKVLRTRVIGGDWPAARTVAGRELPRETPLPNLHNVGDGVRDYGDGGMQSCAVTGIAVADQVLAGRIARAA